MHDKSPIKTVIGDKDKALEGADRQIPGSLDVYTDASIRNGKMGIGVFGVWSIWLAALSDYCPSTRFNYTHG